ncbi:undecaprenyl-diphosphate phosphatase [Sneathiella sp.]|uniref:undecaprenyl-diphosphate phosphatase n=1 Tax=Sneathiella sp. TaxID=1964365 RepID=UPI0039E2A1B6
MEILQILVLAIVQGVTEFLPISSSGHLVLVPLLTGWPDQGLMLDVATHVGSLMAVIAYFRADLIEILQGVFKIGTETEVKDARLLFRHLVIASVPAVLAGGALFYILHTDLRSLLMIASTTLIFGVLLGISDKFCKDKKTVSGMSNWDALVIGLFQILALLPGTSRSGVTMTAARFCGVDRKGAARFSMLLSIPVILGAGVVLSFDLLKADNVEVGLDALITGVVSFGVAYLVIGLLMNWIGRIGFMPFVIYRVVLACGLFGFYLLT